MAENHQVRQGECIFSIAFDKGFFADTIWDHPNNQELKEKRKDPNVLLPLDVVHIPDKRIKELSEPTNEVHKFRCKNTPKLLRIQLVYIDAPVKKIDYTLTIDGLETKGTTDGEGWLQFHIKPNAKIAKIALDGGIEYEIALGHLNPADEMTGVQGRLAHLGFYEGKIDGNFGTDTKNALKAFQVSQNLKPTGEIDSAIEDLLRKLTGV